MRLAGAYEDPRGRRLAHAVGAGWAVEATATSCGVAACHRWRHAGGEQPAAAAAHHAVWAVGASTTDSGEHVARHSETDTLEHSGEGLR